MIGTALMQLAAKASHAAKRPASPAANAQPKRGNGFARSVREDLPCAVPDCATSPSLEASLSKAYFVPVSFVAKDWNVTSRRIRSLLAAGRLTGRREANGYWEVAYPYRFIIGTRGPQLKRQQKPKRGRPKSEESAESL